MIEVTSVEVVGDFRLHLRFNDGVSGVADLGPHLWGEAFEGLQDPVAFSEVFLDEGMGTIAWPNEADFSAEFLRAEIEKAALAPLEPLAP